MYGELNFRETDKLLNELELLFVYVVFKILIKN